MSCLPYGCSVKMFGILSAINLSQLKFFKMAEGRWQEGMEKQSLPWLSCRKMGKLLSGSVKSFSWKSLNILFQETKSKYFVISFWNDMFPFDRNLYLAEKRNKQSISVGNQGIIKTFPSVLGEKKFTTHLFIDMPEVILALFFFFFSLFAQKRESPEYF